MAWLALTLPGWSFLGKWSWLSHYLCGNEKCSIEIFASTSSWWDVICGGDEILSCSCGTAAGLHKISWQKGARRGSKAGMMLDIALRCLFVSLRSGKVGRTVGEWKEVRPQHAGVISWEWFVVNLKEDGRSEHCGRLYLISSQSWFEFSVCFLKFGKLFEECQHIILSHW